MEKKLPESLQKLIKKVEEAFPEDPRMVQLFINCFTNTDHIYLEINCQ